MSGDSTRVLHRMFVGMAPVLIPHFRNAHRRVTGAAVRSFCPRAAFQPGVEIRLRSTGEFYHYQIKYILRIYYGGSKKIYVDKTPLRG